MTNIKILSFIIALKRLKNSSRVPKIAKYRLAKELNLSPNTFCQYLKTSIELGFITEEEKIYRIIPFREIVREIFADTGIFFGKRKILQSDDTNFNEILYDIKQFLVIDNIITQQNKRIDQNYLIDLLQRVSLQTDKKANAEWYLLPLKTRKRIAKLYTKRTANGNKLEFNSNVITSVRHTAKKIGISNYAASKVLRSSNRFTRTVDCFWVNGCSFFKLEELKALHPNATIIPFIKFNKIKVCNGSILQEIGLLL